MTSTASKTTAHLGTITPRTSMSFTTSKITDHHGTTTTSRAPISTITSRTTTTSRTTNYAATTAHTTTTATKTTSDFNSATSISTLSVASTIEKTTDHQFTNSEVPTTGNENEYFTTKTIAVSILNGYMIIRKKSKNTITCLCVLKIHTQHFRFCTFVHLTDSASVEKHVK